MLNFIVRRSRGAVTEGYMVGNVEVISEIFNVLNKEEDVIVVKLMHM